MKRIDDKIKEIEKKDKTNRLLFYGIIVLIIGFLAYVSTTQKKLDNQAETIKKQNITLKEQLDEITAKNTALEETIAKLEKSQTPIGFWNQTVEAKNTSSYISYILHTGKPEAKDEYRTMALENIKLNETAGKTAWLFCGRKNGDKISSDRIMKVIYRKDESPLEDDLPKIGDIIENNTTNRITYSNFSGTEVTGQKNDSDAWKRGSKAQVLDVKTAGNAVFIQIKF